MVQSPNDDEGFSLIELLVVVIIIGILASIAIPTFLGQRERAWTSTAKSDLRNAVIQLEQFVLDGGSYITADPEGFNRSEGVTVSFGSRTATTYCLQVDHGKLPGGVDLHFDSVDATPLAGPC